MVAIYIAVKDEYPVENWNGVKVESDDKKKDKKKEDPSTLCK